MKNLLTALLVCLTISAHAGHWYVSAAGNDANNGTSTSTPFLTIAKLNTKWASILPGDTISFRGGDVFAGVISVAKSGTLAAPIVINSYGTGKALLSAYATLTSWATTANPSIFRATFSAGKINLINVSYDGQIQRMGRYPNADQPALTYEGFTGNTSITDTSLTGTPNFTGAEVWIRKFRWVGDRAKITSHIGNTINYALTGITVNVGANQSLYTPSTSKYGFFIQNDLKTLDREGEWYFNNATKDFYIYTSNPSLHVIKAAAKDSIINVNSRQYITIDNLSFEGTNVSCIYSRNGVGITIKNCTMKNSGYAAIHVDGTSKLRIENNDIDWSLSTGIQAKCSGKRDIQILNNVVNHTYEYQGMADYSNDGSCERGVSVSGDSVKIIGNSILNSGFSGLHFQGNWVIIRRNRIRWYCKSQDDNAGIYTYVGDEKQYGAATTTYVDRLIDSNIVTDGVGNSYAANSPTLFVSGGYMDGKTLNVTFRNNVFASNKRAGITMNNPNGISIINNLFYDDSMAIRASTYAKGSVRNLVIKFNTFVPVRPGQANFVYSTDSVKYASVGAEIAANVLMDSNYVYGLNPLPYRTDVPLVPQANMSLDAWRLFCGQDVHTQLRTAYKDYQLTAQGANKYTNPYFATGITGVVTFGTGTTGTWDNTNQINGGSLKAMFSVFLPNNYGLFHSPVGLVDTTKNYIVRLKTKGTDTNGVLRVYLRKRLAGYNDLAPKQMAAFTYGIKQHEFLIRNPSSQDASLCIEVDKSSGTTYIDDVEIAEATVVNRNLTDSVKVVFDTAASTVPLSYRYKDMQGNTYNGGTDYVTAYGSRVYLFDSAVYSVPNLPPVVDAGINTAITLPLNSVTLTSSSSDDGSIVSYDWTKLSGPATYTINTPTTANTTVSNLVQGLYVFQLTVTDNLGVSSSDTVNIEVKASTTLPRVKTRRRLRNL